MTTRIVLQLTSSEEPAQALLLVSRLFQTQLPGLALTGLSLDELDRRNIGWGGTIAGSGIANAGSAIGQQEQAQQIDADKPSPEPAVTTARGRKPKGEAAPTPPAAGEPATSPSPAPAPSAPPAAAEPAAAPAQQETPTGNSDGAAKAATQSSTAPTTGAPSATGSVPTVAAMRLLMEPKVRGGKRVDVSKAIVAACAEASKLLGTAVPNSLDRLYGDLATLPADRKAEADAVISSLAVAVEAL